MFVSHCTIVIREVTKITVSKVVASVLFDVALSKGWPQHLYFASNPTLVTAASLNSGRLSPSLGHTRGPVEEILSLARPILAKFHLEGSWVVFWSHKHSSLSLLSRTIQFLGEKLFDWPCSLLHIIRISLISVYILCLKIDQKLTLNFHS